MVKKEKLLKIQKEKDELKEKILMMNENKQELEDENVQLKAQLEQRRNEVRTNNLNINRMPQ